MTDAHMQSREPQWKICSSDLTALRAVCLKAQNKKFLQSIPLKLGVILTPIKIRAFLLPLKLLAHVPLNVAKP